MNLKTALEVLAFGLACFVAGGYLLPAVARQHIAEWVQNLRTPKAKRKPKEPAVELKDEWRHDPITRRTRARVSEAALMTSSEDQPLGDDSPLESGEVGSETSESPVAESGPQLGPDEGQEGVGGEDLDGGQEQPQNTGLEGETLLAGQGVPEGATEMPDQVVGVTDEGLGEGENTSDAGSPFAESPAESPAAAPASSEMDLEKATRLLRKKGFSVLKRDKPVKKRKLKRKHKKKPERG